MAKFLLWSYQNNNLGSSKRVFKSRRASGARKAPKYDIFWKILPYGWFLLDFGCFCSTRAFRRPLERVLGNHMHRHSSEKCKKCFSNTSARLKTLQTHKNNILEPLRIWWSRSLYRVKNVPLDMSHTALVREILTKSPQNPIQKPDFLEI